MRDTPTSTAALSLLTLAPVRGATLRETYLAEVRAELAKPTSSAAGDCRDLGGFRRPTRLSAIWLEPEGDLEYFRGRLAKAEYDVEEP